MATTGPRLSGAVERITPSPTATLEAQVGALRAAGEKVYRLGLGEPDFPPPASVKDAAIAAIHEDFNGYTATAGIAELRGAAADRLRADIGLSYAADEIVISVGAKHALFNAAAALLDPSDEVLIPVPYWVSFPEQIRFLGGTPVFVPTTAATGYRVTVAALARAIGPRTRFLILNSPNNPSGAVYPRAELERIAAFCVARDLWVVSDEIYSTFVYTAEGHASIASCEGMRERTIVVSAVSKTYGMTGWRIGYAAAPRAVADAMVTIQSHLTSNPTGIAQRAALAALAGPQEWIAPVLAEYRRRRGVLVDGVRTIQGLACEEPEGSFFVWADASAWLGRSVAGRRIETSDDLAAVLLDEQRVAVMPGAGFGSPSHLRLSFAASLDELEGGIARMGALLGAAVGAR